MGFGFNLFFAFILIPLTIILLIGWAVTRKNLYGKVVAIIWLGIMGLIMISITIQAITSKKTLRKTDYYGQYIIDRDYFPGKQADWQYDSFRFEVKDNDSIYLFVTNKEQITKTIKGVITTVAPYGSERLMLNMPQPRHHIFETDPTVFRSTWSFYLVFNSSKFGNMYFKKGHWNPR